MKPKLNDKRVSSQNFQAKPSKLHNRAWEITSKGMDAVLYIYPKELNEIRYVIDQIEEALKDEAEKLDKKVIKDESSQENIA